MGHRQSLRVKIALAAIALVALAAQAGAGASVDRRPAPKAASQLTRWERIGYWAHAVRPARVHSWPSRSAHTITRLHFRTYEGYPEVYLLLSRRSIGGHTWFRILLPMRPNGTKGWVLRGGLGRVHRVWTWLVIDRTRLRASFYEGGRPVWQAPIGIGAPSTPTPRGLFWVREQFGVVRQPFFGPYAFGTSAYSSLSEWPGGGVVGLHGTSLPYLIPGRPSHGCIRFRNSDILWLASHMATGTPIAILN